MDNKRRTTTIFIVVGVLFLIGGLLSGITGKGTWIGGIAVAAIMFLFAATMWRRK